MGILDKLSGHKDSGVVAATQPAPATGLSAEKVTIAKGSSLSVEKTDLITATVSWNSGTDYDVYALVLKRDGSVEVASQFGTKDDNRFTPVVADGAVRHMGDVGRAAGSQGDANEVIEIRLTSDIVAVVPVAYSAQSNGTGSFHRYRVSLEVNNHAGQVVGVDSANANNDDRIYTCVPAVIRNMPTGVIIEAVELYSKRGSEHRPTIDTNGVVHMDAGPVNAYK